MAKARPAAERSGTRERVLAEAEALLIRGGYAMMSLEAVAQAVGIRKASLYHHFPDGKDALFIAMVEARTAHDNALLLDELAAEATIPAKLRAVIGHFQRYAGHRPYRAILDAAQTLPEALRARVVELIARRVEGPIRGVIAAGIAAGTLDGRDPEIVTRIFFDLLRVLGNYDGDPRAATLPDQLLAFFLAGLKAL